MKIKHKVGIVCLSLSLACAIYAHFGFDSGKTEMAHFELKTVYSVEMSSSLPRLEDESSPYFSSQTKPLDDGGKLVTYCFRKDKSVTHLYFRKDNLLRRIEAYRNSNDKQELAYEADYDKSGRRISKACYYSKDGKPETLIESAADGGKTYSFYRAGQLIKRSTLAANGAETTVNYENGSAQAAVTTDAPAAQSKDLVHWDAEKKLVRLRVQTVGNRLASWEYFGKDGVTDHTGKVMADESLEFSYPEKGKLKRRQVWRLVGEDWERSYYQLSYSEAFADDGKTIEHKVWVRSNGSLLRHERFNGKNGALEMQRDFDLESRVARVEDYKETGESKQLWVFPASGNRSRGFVPTGMRGYPGGDDKIGYVYNLDGQPFTHSVLDPHPWAFFETGKN